MSDSDRKEATREGPGRPSRRALRRNRKAEEHAASEGAGSGQDAEPSGAEGDRKAEGKQEPQSKRPSGKSGENPPADAKPAGGKKDESLGLDHSGDVSSLLETTGEDVKRLLRAADHASQNIRDAARTEAADPVSDASAEAGETTSLIGRINKEVQNVLETADEAADKIREEARAEARQLIEEARRRGESVTKRQIDRVGEMTDQVMGELAAVQGRLERLQAAYDQAIKTMGTDLGVEDSRVWDTEKNGELEPGEEAEELRRRLGKRTSRRSAQEPEGISEGARLLALQQMMAGVDPSVIERRLRDEFGIDDPKPILEWMGLQAANPGLSDKSKKR